MIFATAIVIGVMLGIVIPYNLTTATLPYVAVAIVAALDSVFGGLLANSNKKFSMSIFITGLFSNAILAVLMTYMGNMLGLSLYFAVIVVFGVRIFNNMAAIRRATLDKYFEKRLREKERRLKEKEAAESDKESEGSEPDKESEETENGEKSENSEMTEKTEEKKSEERTQSAENS